MDTYIVRTRRCEGTGRQRPTAAAAAVAAAVFRLTETDAIGERLILRLTFHVYRYTLGE